MAAITWDFVINCVVILWFSAAGVLLCLACRTREEVQIEMRTVAPYEYALLLDPEG